MLFIAKELVPLSFVEAPFFRRLILKYNPRLNFPSRQKFRNELLPMITKWTKERFLFLALQSCNTCTISFDLWMLSGSIYTFVLIVHFLNDKWEPCPIIVRFFETIDTSRNAMAIQVNDVLAKHGLNTHVFAYVKNEGSNFATMTSTLTFVVFCCVLGTSTPFVGSCWGHVMFKCYQYAIDDSKVCVNLLSISIKKT